MTDSEQIVRRAYQVAEDRGARPGQAGRPPACGAPRPR